MPALPLLLLFILLLIANQVQGREVDNYLAWGVEIDDAGPALDRYMRAQLEAALDQVNRPSHVPRPATKKPAGGMRVRKRHESSCYRAAHDLLRAAFYYPTYQKIEQFLEEDPVIDRYPRRPRDKGGKQRAAAGQTAAEGYLSNREYRKASIVKTSPFNVPLSRVVNVYGIYTGTDKLGHFTSFGARYLKNFDDQVRAGVDKQTAFDQVMDSSYQSENGVVGMYFTKVFSRGDIEANFQGMLFAWTLCQPQSTTRLQRQDGAWQLLNLEAFTIRDYVNPGWDESFNTSLFSAGKWRKHVVPTFVARKDCDKLETAWVRKQQAQYRDRFQHSLSTHHGKRWMPENMAGRHPDEHALATFCAAGPAAGG